MDKKDKITRMIQHTVAELHVREAGEGEKESRTITGYAIMFDVPSTCMYRDEDEECYETVSRDAVTQELLDESDIKMTMYHDDHILLARSNKGQGTLKYGIDEKGVYFEFEAPKTQYGDEAIELVKRGDISGCSFAFTTKYWDDAYVSHDVEKRDGKTIITYHVNIITGIYDFTLTPDPAYPDTSCEALREITNDVTGRRAKEERDKADAAKAAAEKQKRVDEQLEQMRKDLETNY